MRHYYCCTFSSTQTGCKFTPVPRCSCCLHLDHTFSRGTYVVSMYTRLCGAMVSLPFAISMYMCCSCTIWGDEQHCGSLASLSFATYTQMAAPSVLARTHLVKSRGLSSSRPAAGKETSKRCFSVSRVRSYFNSDAHTLQTPSRPYIHIDLS